jgi:hypothetical protein
MGEPLTDADLDACAEHVAEFGDLNADLIDRLIAEVRRLQKLLESDRKLAEQAREAPPMPEG